MTEFKLQSGNISHFDALASMLEITSDRLLYISNNMNEFYRKGATCKKKSGEPRPTSDAEPELKKIHTHLKNRLLKTVQYPYFIAGCIEDEDNPRSPSFNASIHCDQKIVINLDIKDFYPKTKKENVHSIWQNFFKCHPTVAEILTKITTYNINSGYLPQGWITSSYIANLIFWDTEETLVNNFKKIGLKYSRYVDDITISSNARISKLGMQEIISTIATFLNKKNYQLNRKKINIQSAATRMEVTGFNVNSISPSIPRWKRSEVRSLVHKLGKIINKKTPMYESAWKSASGKLSHISQVRDKSQNKKLRARLNSIKPNLAHEISIIEKQLNLISKKDSTQKTKDKINSRIKFISFCHPNKSKHLRDMYNKLISDS